MKPELLSIPITMKNISVEIHREQVANVKIVSLCQRGLSSLIRSDALSAIMMVGAFVLAETRTGMTEVSATRRLLMPFTLGGVSHVVKGDGFIMI